MAFETSWYGLDRNGTFPGDPAYARELAPGRADAPDWVPPEVDVSIRPGWFHHAAEDAKLKSVGQLLDIYETSVGRGANLLLNVPPDARGLIPETDASRLRAFRAALDATFSADLARGAAATATNVRGGSARFAANRINDGRADTYWATDDGVTRASVELTLSRPTACNLVVLQEFIALGQRIEGWTVDAEVDGVWRTVASGTTVGHKRIARFEPVVARRVRVTVTRARACPTLSTVSLYAATR